MPCQIRSGRPGLSDQATGEARGLRRGQSRRGDDGGSTGLRSSESTANNPKTCRTYGEGNAAWPLWPQQQSPCCILIFSDAGACVSISLSSAGTRGVEGFAEQKPPHSGNCTSCVCSARPMGMASRLSSTARQAIQGLMRFNEAIRGRAELRSHYLAAVGRRCKSASVCHFVTSCVSVFGHSWQRRGERLGQTFSTIKRQCDHQRT